MPAEVASRIDSRAQLHHAVARGTSRLSLNGGLGAAEPLKYFRWVALFGQVQSLSDHTLVEIGLFVVRETVKQVQDNALQLVHLSLETVEITPVHS